MDTINQMCKLLEEQKDLLLDYEQATLAILDADADSVEQYIIERGRLATEIDAVNEWVYSLCGETPNGEILLKTANASLAFEQVPSEFHCVFYEAQSKRSVINRILESEKQAIKHLESLRDEALDAIKQNQNVPKIKKYLTGLQDQPATIKLTSEKA